ncbi:MAG: DUF2382 domain-containing protein [Bryobacteraceae bacterium]
MLKEKEFPVYDENGFRGTLLSAARFLDPSPEKRIRLEDGREMKVPSSALVAQPDGSYFLHTAGQPPSEPKPEPPAEPEPRRILNPSAFEPLFREDCDVERVPVKRMLDQPVEIRQEGDTLIIPLMEEVLVVEKRLMLREELHIKRRREHKAEGDRTPIPVDELPR